MHIDRQLFMGAGDHSLAQVGYLHIQLSKAVTILGGIQQPPDPTIPPNPDDPEWEDVVEEGQMDVDRIAGEIYLALTGVHPPRRGCMGPRLVEKTVEKKNTKPWLNWVIGGILLIQAIFLVWMFFFL